MLCCYTIRNSLDLLRCLFGSCGTSASTEQGSPRGALGTYNVLVGNTNQVALLHTQRLANLGQLQARRGFESEVTKPL